MGKSLDELSDRTLSSTPHLTPEAEDTLDLCRELLDDPRYQWAWGTVSGIRESITNSGKATPGQVNALQNIKAGGQRTRNQVDRVRWNRRYDGY